MPRPPKINREILDIFRGLVKEENLLLACTDEDMVLMLNEELFVEHQISYRTFQRYKARALKEQSIPDADPLYVDLVAILRTGYVRLRQQLLGAILKDHIGSKRYMWVLERKFREWNLRSVPQPAEAAAGQGEEQDAEGPIPETEERYPTMTGTYLDPEHKERPKDIAPAHHALFQGYVLPNPDYDGPEDDTTRALASMKAFMDEYHMPKEEHDKMMAERGRESDRLLAERRRREAEKAAEEAKLPNAGPLPPRRGDKRDAEVARERLLDKIKNRNGTFYEEGPDDDEYVPYDIDELIAAG